MDAFYREACLQAALNHYAARRDGQKPSLRDAAAEYSVSPSTLRHRLLNGNRTASEAARERQKLTESQEKALVDMLHRRSAVGYPMTPGEVTSLADKFFEARGSTVHLGMRWFPSFKLRHPDIHTVRSNCINHSRMYAVDSATVEAYFKILGTYLREEAILPEDVWNADKSGLMMGRSQSSQVVVPLLQKGKKRAVAADNGDRETVSCMACVSAAGAHLQPVLVFSRTQAKREACGKAVEAGLAPPDEAKYLGTPGNAVRVFHSKNGFLTSQLIVQWLQEVFLPATARDPPRTRVLVIDGACAHATHEVMYECAKNGVKLVYLPAHSSHLTQPLDPAVFSPLKNYYGQAVKVLSRRLAGRPWGREEFISIFLGAWQKALNRQNITSGFRQGGIWPYDPQAVRRSVLSYNNSVEPASEAAKKPERPALATLTTNAANTLPKTVKATRATLQAAGKERYEVLELALAETREKIASSRN